MKALITVLFALLFVACGAGTTPPCTTDKDCASDPGAGCGWTCINQECKVNCTNCTVSADCTNGQLCMDSRCVDPQCWSDNACPQFNRCIDNVCVEKPECANDTECTGGLLCLEYKCRPYTDKDTCLAQACTGHCTDCGSLTYCYGGQCTEACLAKVKMEDDVRTTACIGLTDNCMICKCWNLSRMDNNGDICEEHKYPICNEIEDTGAKSRIPDIDWNAVADGIKSSCS